MATATRTRRGFDGRLMKQITAKDATRKKTVFRSGDKVLVNVCGEWHQDTVRACFWQTILLEPISENLLTPALILTVRSWVEAIHAKKV